MILTRLGNKRKMADKLHAHFPKHRLRIEPFFGAGGSFFYLPLPDHAILNDLDDDVSNLYLVVIHQKEELQEAIRKMPIAEGLLNHWVKNEETDKVLKAARFLFLSDYTYLGKGDTMRFGIDNTKQNLLDRIDPTFEKLKNAKIMNTDFRNVLKKISFHESVTPKKDSFVYLDPIYLDTEHYYRVPKWSATDTKDCFEFMATSGINCAMSEFNHPVVLELAAYYDMNVIYLKERQNIKTNAQKY